MTLRRMALLIGAAGLIAAIAAVYFRAPSVPPPGQPALSTLRPPSFGEFGAAFDAHLEQPRLILLLSPT